MSVIPNSVDNIFTFVLTNGTFDVVSEFGVMGIAMELISGAATFQGSLKLGTNSSTPIPLVVSDPVSITQSQAIDKLTIVATVGVVNIICRRA